MPTNPQNGTCFVDRKRRLGNLRPLSINAVKLDSIVKLNIWYTLDLKLQLKLSSDKTIHTASHCLWTESAANNADISNTNSLKTNGYLRICSGVYNDRPDG